MNATTEKDLPIFNPEWQELHCSKDALTDVFGWFLQGLLAGIAFTCLIVKRFCEPVCLRRSWEVWWFDTSKQGIGALFIHMTNVYLAPLFQGDPCTWYIINFLLDSTIGLFIIYIGVRVCQYLAKTKKMEAINFGNYSAKNAWVYQTWIYVGLMVIIKVITTLFIQLDFWDNVKNFVLSPFSDPKIELVVVILLIPFFVNMFIFWVTDNFLMRHNRKKRLQAQSSTSGHSHSGHHHHQMSSEPGLLQRVKVKYRSVRKDSIEKPEGSESEALISGDDDELIIGSKSLLQNSSMTTPSHGPNRPQRTNVLL